MTDNIEPYNLVKRKRELVESLQIILGRQLEASEKLDEKAWEILRITSATFSIVTSLQIILAKDNIGVAFVFSLIVILVLYLFQVSEVLNATAPRDWGLVPGTHDGKLNYEALRDKYILRYDEKISTYTLLDEEVYLDKLIVDYAGKLKNPPDNDEILLGVIAIAQNYNKDKAKHIRYATILLGVIILALMFTAIVAVTKFN